MPRICRAGFPACQCTGFSNPVFPPHNKNGVVLFRIPPGFSPRHPPSETGDRKVARTGRLENLPYAP